MPFVSRIIEPKYLSQKSLLDENGKSLVSDFELEAIANNTLTNVLRQLASLVLVANDIFENLAKDLRDVYERSCKLKLTINVVEEKLVQCDPKTVTVPESDICTFSLRTIHFKSSHPITTGLFTNTSRPSYVQKLYESAAPTPVHTIRHLDRFRRDGTRSSKFFMCTPVLGPRKKRFKKIDLEIETRKPIMVEDLRKWTSTEALGDITVLPDNTSKIAVETSEDENKDGVDHLLPSPEEQMMAVAMKFPPSIVAVDISGKPFDRMSGMRRSFVNVENASDVALPRRRTKKRQKGKRRNTIAGTSQREIEQAIAGETATETEGCEFEPLPPLRSKSTDLFKLPKTNLSPTDNLKNHFNTLKNWSKTKLKFMNKNNSIESCKPSFQGTDVVDDIGVYETVSNCKYKKEKERKPSSSSSAISIPVSTSSITTSLVVKLRENSLQRRHWRKGANKGQDEPAHSSSGNWSASSESGRTSIASEITALPKSSTTTSNNSLNHHHSHHHHPPPSVQSRRRYFNNSTSSSVSEGTLTPDINEMQYHDLLDGETSSVYSCDTEGYYTSFHMDSGLKTLKEEEIALSFSTLQLPEVFGSSSNTTTFNNTSSSGSTLSKTNQLTAENEYELFGKGSTSTTTSSAGTVCTTLLAGNTYGSSRSLSQFAPAVPERKSSLERKSDKKQICQIKETNEIQLLSDNNSDQNDELETTTVVALIHDSPSPDSGHNTSSSPVENTSQNSQSPHEHLEFSESDLESCDRTERIRTKTAMTTCRIPSMCMITPPQSDDEVNLRNNQVPYKLSKYVPFETITQNDSVKNNQNLMNGNLYAQSDEGKPLHIQIPQVPDLKKQVTDIYAYPDKSKKTKTNTVKTISTNGVLETNIDSIDESQNLLHLIVNKETGYATIKNEITRTHRSPSPSGGTAVIKSKEEIPKISQPVLKPSLLPSNFMEKFKEAMNKQKIFEKKNDDGDYVTIVDSKKSESNSKTDLKHSNLEENKSEYVSLNELPSSKSLMDNPLTSSNDSSLERKKRQGARVTLDSEGKVVYSSDSLKRKKQHTTFIPGKYVRESPTPSPVLDKRISKPIRPVVCSGLIRTNACDKNSNSNSKAMSPQLRKVIIKAESRACNSPTKDIVRMQPSRVVTPTNATKKIDKGPRVEFGNRESENRTSSTPSSEQGSLKRKQEIIRCTSPSSSSSSSSDPKKSEADTISEQGSNSISSYWISQHPSVSKRQQQFYSPSGFPRNHPMYWTLPARSVYAENPPKKFEIQDLKNSPRQIHHAKLNPQKSFNPNLNSSSSSSQRIGAIEQSHDLSSVRLVQNIRKEFTSSTPTKELLQNSSGINLANGVSPILKENLFSTKSKMTAEEIFAAIHKSKKKLNIKQETENKSGSHSSSSLSPDISENCLVNKVKERSSWSPPETDTKSNEPRTRKSWIGATTPISSFKKLLLQQGVKNSPSKDLRISAVEQLKLSKQSDKQEIKNSPRTMANSKSRLQWKFAPFKTDVLSSTILEDCNEVEKQEDSKKRQTEKLSLGFAEVEGSSDCGNLQTEPDSRDSKSKLGKLKENKSLEITKKYLQQARKNFFSEPTCSSTLTPNKNTPNASFDSLNLKKSISPLTTKSCLQSSQAYVNSNNKIKCPISLETAL